MPRCHVGLVFAMALEAEAFEKRLTGLISIASGWTTKQGGWKGRSVVVVHAGAGTRKRRRGYRRADLWTQTALDHFSGTGWRIAARGEAERHCDADAF